MRESSRAVLVLSILRGFYMERVTRSAGYQVLQRALALGSDADAETTLAHKQLELTRSARSKQDGLHRAQLTAQHALRVERAYRAIAAIVGEYRQRLDLDCQLAAAMRMIVDCARADARAATVASEHALELARALPFVESQVAA